MPLNLTPEKASSDPRFYCHIVNGKPELKRVHLFQVIWVGQDKSGAVFNILKKKTGYISLNIWQFLPSTFNAKISDYRSEISASDFCKLCRSASIGSTHTSLLCCLPYLVSLE